MGKAKKMATKRWQFLWCDVDSPPKNGDAHDWRSKVFRAATFERAMDLMLAYVDRKPFECFVDYECAALHVPYVTEKHDDHFHRIDTTEHELSEHCG